MTRRSCIRATVLLVLSLTPACATTRIAGSASPSIAQATLSVADRQYQLSACSSGDLEYFLGVDLADQKGGAFVRVLIDPMDGPRLRIVLREGDARETLFLGRDQCRQLEGDVRYTGWEVNTVRDFSGFLDAECRSGEGRAISLHTRFAHCH